MITVELKGGPLNGKVVKLANGSPLHVPVVMDRRGDQGTFAIAVYSSDNDWECVVKQIV